MKGTAKQLELIAALLREETTLSLATSDANCEACVAPLFYIADKELSLYWLSSGNSLHSLNLEKKSARHRYCLSQRQELEGNLRRATRRHGEQSYRAGTLRRAGQSVL